MVSSSSSDLTPIPENVFLSASGTTGNMPGFLKLGQIIRAIKQQSPAHSAYTDEKIKALLVSSMQDWTTTPRELLTKILGQASLPVTISENLFNSAAEKASKMEGHLKLGAVIKNIQQTSSQHSLLSDEKIKNILLSSQTGWSVQGQQALKQLVEISVVELLHEYVYDLPLIEENVLRSVLNSYRTVKTMLVHGTKIPCLSEPEFLVDKFKQIFGYSDEETRTLLSKSINNWSEELKKKMTPILNDLEKLAQQGAKSPETIKEPLSTEAFLYDANPPPVPESVFRLAAKKAASKTTGKSILEEIVKEIMKVSPYDSDFYFNEIKDTLQKSKGSWSRKAQAFITLLLEEDRQATPPVVTSPQSIQENEWLPSSEELLALKKLLLSKGPKVETNIGGEPHYIWVRRESPSVYSINAQKVSDDKNKAAQSDELQLYFDSHGTVIDMHDPKLGENAETIPPQWAEKLREIIRILVPQSSEQIESPGPSPKPQNISPPSSPKNQQAPQVQQQKPAGLPPQAPPIFMQPIKQKPVEPVGSQGPTSQPVQTSGSAVAQKPQIVKDQLDSNASKLSKKKPQE